MRERNNTNTFILQCQEVISAKEMRQGNGIESDKGGRKLFYIVRIGKIFSVM